MRFFNSVANITKEIKITAAGNRNHVRFIRFVTDTEVDENIRILDEKLSIL